MSNHDFLLNQLDLTDLDAFNKAMAIQAKAGEVGFDFKSVSNVINKIHEELNEVTEEIEGGVNQNRQKITAELGDLFFACCNLARHLQIDPATATELTNQKFRYRFNFVETCVAAAGKNFNDFSPEELNAFWEQAKQLERLKQTD